MPSIAELYGAKIPGVQVGKRPLDGRPVFGPQPRIPDYYRDQADDLPTRYGMACRMFCLWRPQDLEEYTGLRRAAANGEIALIARAEFRCTSDETEGNGQHLKVWLEWAVPYATVDSPRKEV